MFSAQCNTVLGLITVEISPLERPCLVKSATLIIKSIISAFSFVFFESKFSQKLPLLSESNTITTGFTHDQYFSYEELTASLGLFLKNAVGLSDDVRISERLGLPRNRLRGFKPGQIGPVDQGDDHVGGNYAASLNFSSTIPQILENSENIDFLVFLDAANVWGVDYDSSLDKNGIRSSVGVGLDWLTPVGPLTFSFAQPITKEPTDIEETFRFNIGTSF